MNPPWKDKNNPLLFGVRAGSRWPHFQKLKSPGTLPNYIPFPHFLATAAALLKSNSYCVMLTDAIAEDIDTQKTLSKINDFKPDMLLIEVSTPSIETDIELCRQIRKNQPDCLIAVAGPHEPMYSQQFLEENKEIDFVFIGEYEETLLETLDALYAKEPDFSKIKGLVFRDKENKPRSTGRRAPTEDLDRLPAYACEYLPMDRYNDRPCGLPAPSLQMWTSRGCPFGCTFCQWPQIMYNQRHLRAMSPELAVKRSAELVKKYGLKSVYFDDDTFNVGKERSMEFCRLMKQYLPGLDWAIMARVDLMDEELLRTFADSGLFSLKYGIETADPAIQKSCSKNIDLEKARQMIQLTKELGIRVQLTFTFGFPEDTKESIEKTIDFACRTNPDYAQFSILTPFPGTKLYNDLIARGYIEEISFSGYNASTTAVTRTDTLSGAELEQSLSLAYERFFAQKRSQLKT